MPTAPNDQDIDTVSEMVSGRLVACPRFFFKNLAHFEEFYRGVRRSPAVPGSVAARLAPAKARVHAYEETQTRPRAEPSLDSRVDSARGESGALKDEELTGGRQL